MMHIVIACVIRGNMLQRVPGKSIAAVVVYSLDGAAGKEHHALACRQASDFEGNAGAKSVKKKAFKGVIV